MLVAHPSDLTLNEISAMSRERLIEQLLVFNDFCSFRFDRRRLESLTPAELRGLLYAARRHFHSKGY